MKESIFLNYVIKKLKMINLRNNNLKFKILFKCKLYYLILILLALIKFGN